MTWKTTKNDGFWMFFWSFWDLNPILAHQTAKFELSEQFSGHPCGPWECQSSGVICIWKFFQLFFWCWRHLAKKIVYFKLKPHVTYFSWLKSDNITFQSHKSMILKEIHSFNPWFWNISIKKRSLWGQDCHYFSVNIQDGTWDRMGQSLYFLWFCLF